MDGHITLNKNTFACVYIYKPMCAGVRKYVCVCAHARKVYYVIGDMTFPGDYNLTKGRM